MTAAHRFDLERFVRAQDGAYADACRELAAGRKTSHWMWFVFPQLAVLGRSATARFFGIEVAAEASAYLAHPVLGPRLRHCAGLLLRHQGRSAHEIMGSPDDLKLCSCMTLFEHVAPPREQALFGEVLERYFQGRRDPLTARALVDQARGLPD
jgi:uncharacterized protein (DUF1810 family)